MGRLSDTVGQSQVDKEINRLGTWGRMVLSTARCTMGTSGFATSGYGGLTFLVTVQVTSPVLRTIRN
jgi:hypothetical protein